MGLTRGAELLSGMEIPIFFALRSRYKIRLTTGEENPELEREGIGLRAESLNLKSAHPDECKPAGSIRSFRRRQSGSTLTHTPKTGKKDVPPYPIHIHEE